MDDGPAGRTTLAEFLARDDLSDIGFQLLDGRIVPRGPHSQTHGRIVGAIVQALRDRRPPDHAVLVSAALVLGPDTCALADLALTGEPPGDGFATSPSLIVEVLAPESVRDDLGVKLPGYQALPSVREIWLVDSSARGVQVLYRKPDGWLQALPIRTGSIRSDVLDGDVSIDELYDRTAL